MDHFSPSVFFACECYSSPLLVEDLCDPLPRDLSILVDNFKPHSGAVSLQRSYEGTSSSEEGIYDELSFLCEKEDEFSNQRLRKRSWVANLLVAAGLGSMDEPGFSKFYPFCTR